MLKKEIVYFDKPGPQNTDALIQAVSDRLKASNIRHIVVASTRGGTALKVADALAGPHRDIVCVAEHSGFAGGDRQLLSDETRIRLEKKGVNVHIGSHVLSGIERSLSKKFGGVGPVETIAHTLRLFGCEGVKVAVEIAVMAADAGLIPTDQEAISIGGTSSGADTAVVLKAAHMNNFFELEIREIIAKPRQRKS